MNFKLIGGISAAAVVAGLSLAVVPSAQADTTVTLRSGDFVSYLQDVESQGHVQFADDGLSVVTDAFTPATAGQSKAADDWATDTPLAAAGEPTLDWSGTDTKPGINLYVDLDGDSGTSLYNNQLPDGADAILVGESVYNDDGTPDWWATNSSVLTAGAPLTTGGSGSGRHGTLDGWRALYPNAKVVAEGFSLGSGARGSGVISDETLGDTTYRFTDKDAVVPIAPVTDAPAGVKVTATTSTSVTLSYGSVSGAVYYRGYRSGAATNVSSSSTGTMLIAGLQPNTTYQFWVAGVDGNGAYGPGSAKATARTATVTLAKPTGLKVTSATGSTLAVAANPVAHADHYLWYVDGIAHGSSDGPAYTIRGLRSGTSYKLSVAADTVTTAPGPQSSQLTAKTR